MESNEEWIEISKRFIDVCDAVLSPGEMLALPKFQLSQAMGAFEVMNPKLDPGVIYPGEPRPISIVDAYDAGWIKNCSFSAIDLIYIVDRMQSQIIKWRNGSHPANSIYTCVFVMEPGLLQDELLSMLFKYFLGVIEFTSFIIRAAGVAGPEEFIHPDLLNFSRSTPPAEPGDFQDDVRKIVANIRDKAADQSKPDAWQWLALKYRTDIWEMLTTLLSLNQDTSTPLDAPPSVERLQLSHNLQVKFSAYQTSEELAKLEERVQTALPSMIHQNLWMGFHPSLFRHMTTGQNDNAAWSTNVALAKKDMQFFYEGMSWVKWDISNAGIIGQLPHACQQGRALDFIYYMNSQQKADTVHRSNMAAILLGIGQPTNSSAEVAVRDAYLWCGSPLLDASTSPAYAEPANQPCLNENLRGIFTDISVLITDTLRCLLRSRVGQYQHAGPLLKKWEELTGLIAAWELKMLLTLADALDPSSDGHRIVNEYCFYGKRMSIDGAKRDYDSQEAEMLAREGRVWLPIHQYCLLWKAFLMISFLMLRFELNYQSGSDYGEAFFWATNLFGFKAGVHEKAQDRFKAAKTLSEQYGGSLSTEQPKPRRIGLTILLRGGAEMSQHYGRSIAQAAVMDAYRLAFTGLMSRGYLKLGSRSAKAERARYARRMEIFTAVKNPPPYTYEDFQRGLETLRTEEYKDLDLLGEAIKSFERAKHSIDRLANEVGAVAAQRGTFIDIATNAECERLGRVCMQNIECLKQVMSVSAQGKETESLKILTDHDHHHELPTLRLVPAEEQQL
eukprot:Clim_evm14s99 gene=Clim_evmTU14s99